MDFNADRLQDYLDRIAAGTPAEDVLRAAADQAEGDELGALVALATRLVEVVPSHPDAGFRAQLQSRLQASIATRRRRPAAGSRASWLSHLLPRLVTVGLALALIFGTTVRVSADSLPGDALYGVKRAAEEVRLALAITPRLRARAELDIARARLDEIKKLVDSGLPVDLEIIEALIAAHEGLAASLPAAHDPGLTADAVRTAQQHQRLLADLAQAAPDPRVRPALREGADGLGDLVSGLKHKPEPPAPGAMPPTAAGGDSPNVTPTPAGGTPPPSDIAASVTPTIRATRTDSPPTGTPSPHPTARPTAFAQPPTHATVAPPGSEPPTAAPGPNARPTDAPNNPSQHPRATDLAALATHRAEAATRRADQATKRAAQATRRSDQATPKPERTPDHPLHTAPPPVEPTRPPQPPATRDSAPPFTPGPLRP